jgi:hypothetical protein
MPPLMDEWSSKSNREMLRERFADFFEGKDGRSHDNTAKN